MKNLFSKFQNWLNTLFNTEIKPMEIRYVTYKEANRLIEEDSSWEIAPMEDMNAVIGMVHLQRPAKEKKD